MGTRVSYPFEVKENALRLRLAGVPVAEVMDLLGIKNKTQLKVWKSWYLVKGRNTSMKWRF